MRLSLTVLGWTLDLNLEPDVQELVQPCSLDGGTTYSETAPVVATDLHMGFTNGLDE